MKRLERASWIVSRGPRRLRLAGLLLGSIAAVPGAALADTVLNFDFNGNLIASGSTAFCAVGNACPSDPAFALTSNTALSGTLSVDETTDTMTFDLTMASASFGSLGLAAGSTFVAPMGSPVSVTITTSHGVTTIGAGSTSTVT
ncbi:MAG TPA: hypothetical protein VK437_06165, partial [Steroidobacteraceae bacterium]|nr:hypothetical protein [Steroidobacteraceae bacterium]